MMDRQQQSFGLHASALRGDAESFQMALELGADINALDDAGRTVLMCAVAGERWEEIDASDASFVTPGRLKVIQIIIEHPNVTLYTLNAPQSAMNGVTPLGMASWLNSPKAVQCLLEGSRGTVSVNGMDGNAATPLMYAARDGNLEVTRLLLSHGSRPDFRDRNHRTSIQFSLGHSHILWECEVALRQHRFKESRHSQRSRLLSSSENLLSLSETFLSTCPKEISPSVISARDSTNELTRSLIQSIHSSDFASVQSLLFSCSTLSSTHSPLLVNRPDCNGWSPIHHCATGDKLSVTILDALYCAGADVSLFTAKEHHTPLHCLARSARLSEDDLDPSLALYQFAVHLIRDLQAPLSARDKNNETCIHIAAEHGACLDLLIIFLECDSTGSIRKLKNSRGLTALEVAKPEFRVAFGDDCDRLRSVSSLSNHTIRALRPTASLTSIVSFNDRVDGFPMLRDAELILENEDIGLSSQQLISKLRSTVHDAHQLPEANVDDVTEILAQSRHLGQVVLKHYRGRAEDIAKDFGQIRAVVAHLSSSLDKVHTTIDSEVSRRGLQPLHFRGGHFRDSQDSQATAVAGDDDDYVHIASDKSPMASGQCSPRSISSKPTDACSIAIQNACLDLIRAATKESHSPPSFFSSISGLMSTQPVCLATLVDEEAFLEAQATPLEIMKPQHKSSEKTFDVWKRKWKSWFGKKPVDKLSHARSKPQLTIDTGKSNSLSVAEGVCSSRDEHVQLDLPLRMAYVVLDAARKDLQKVEEILVAADRFMSTAHHSISRAERVIDRAIKKRQTTLDTLWQLCPSNSSPTSPRSNRSLYLLAPSPSSSLSSPNASCTSLAVTLTENDDEDIRALRRLLLRKIEASLGGSMDELSRVAGWLPLIKEATAGIKRSICL